MGDRRLREAERTFAADSTEENLENLMRIQVSLGRTPIIPKDFTTDRQGNLQWDWGHEEPMEAFLCNHCNTFRCVACDTPEDEISCDHGSICAECVKICGYCSTIFCPKLAHECEICGYHYCSDECRVDHEMPDARGRGRGRGLRPHRRWNPDASLRELERRWGRGGGYRELCDYNIALARVGRDPVSISDLGFRRAFSEQFGNWHTSPISIDSMSNFQPTLSREDLGPDYPQMTHYLVRTNLLFEGDSLSADNLDALFNDTADFARCLGWVSIRTLLHINLNSHEEIQVEEWLLGKRVKDFNTQKDIDDHFDVNTLTERVNQQEPNLYFGPYALEDSDLKEAREAHQILSHALEQARLDQKIFFLPFSVLRPTGTINPRNATGRGYTMLADFPERYGQPSYITLFQIHRKPGSPQSQFVTWACDSRTDGCNAGDYYFTYENAVEGYLRRLLKLR